MKKKFDATIVATSKAHINNKKIMENFLQVSGFVFGVAESKYFPAIYPCLIGVNEKFIQNKSRDIQNNRIFVFGSCQSNGWTSQLRAILDVINFNCDEFQMHKRLFGGEANTFDLTANNKVRFQKNKDQQTIMMVAARYGRVEIMELCLDQQESLGLNAIDN